MDEREPTNLAETLNDLVQPWGPLTLVREEVEMIEVPNRSVKPRRFEIIVSLKGVTWRRVQVEISPDEGQAGVTPESIPSPSLAGFGLPSPDRLTSLSTSYQIAQKIHACTDPHDPPAFVNDRARDVIDLLLLRELVESTQHPTLGEVRSAVEDVFAARGGSRCGRCDTPLVAGQRHRAFTLGNELRERSRVCRPDDLPRRCHRPTQRLARAHRAGLTPPS